MNKNLATVLKNKLIGLGFVETLAGLVQTVEYSAESDDMQAKPLTKRMPVACDTTAAPECNVGPELALVPDSNKRGILYFEDGGVAPLKANGPGWDFRSTLVLVCWMNRELLVGDAYQEISAQCITMILKRLVNGNPINVDVFTRLKVEVGRIFPQDKSVFSKYTYDEKVTQYLRPPFEFFAIQLLCTYNVNGACVQDLNDFLTQPPCTPSEGGQIS